MTLPTEATTESAGRNPDPVDLYVGGRIRMRRKIIGVSQEQLANALGLTFQQIQKYERGANRVSASMLWKIARRLQVPVQFFFPNIDSDNGVEEAAEDPTLALAAAPGGLELADAYLQCDGHRRRSLLSVAVAVSETMTPARGVANLQAA